MGGVKHKKITRQSGRFLPAEILVEAILLGTGLFEAVIFILGSLTGDAPSMLIIVGAVYFAIPYNLLLIGPGVPGSFLRMGEWQKFLALALCNLPFVTYLWLQGNGMATRFLMVLVALGLLCNMPKVHIRTIPGIDMLSIALFLGGPFVYGVLLAGMDGLWWLPAWLSMLLVIMANYLMYKLPSIGLERYLHVDGTDVRLGLERAVMASLGLYLVAALLPAIAYGWRGLPATVLILWYVIVALQAIPFRMLAGAAGLYRVWRAIWWLNYPVATLLAVYVWVLISRQSS